MKNKKNNYRYEIKFVSKKLQYDFLKNLIQIHPQGFITPYPPRIINNLYFDDFQRSAFQENIDGLSQRNKIRMRWYGEKTNPKTAILELKSKKNRLRWKSLHPIKLNGFNFGENWIHELEPIIAPQLDKSFFFEYSARNIPTLFNRYEREYFQSIDGRVRFTLDKNIEYANPQTTPNIATTHKIKKENTIILEMKVDTQNIKFGREALNGIPLSPSRFSKYIVGLKTIE